MMPVVSADDRTAMQPSAASYQYHLAAPAQARVRFRMQKPSCAAGCPQHKEVPTPERAATLCT